MGHFLGVGAVVALFAIVCLGNHETDDPMPHAVNAVAAPGCQDCDGHGQAACVQCDGSGINPKLMSRQVVDGDRTLIPVDCPVCFASGQQACLACKGTGKAAH